MDLSFVADDGWPHMVWVEPARGDFMAILDHPMFDLASLDWRARALVLATAKRLVRQLEAIEGEQ